MLGKANPQASLLGTKHARRHLITKNSFYARLAEHGHEILSDDDYAHLYSRRTGRPSIPPMVMIRAMLCATHDRTASDAETSRRTRVDADWKAAMGVDDDFEGIGATTFSLMRARMVAHEADGKPFEATLARAVQAKIFKDNLTAIVDSSPIHGAGAVSDTYELIRGFLKKTIKAAGRDLSPQTIRAAGQYLGGKPEIDWQDPGARKQHLRQLVEISRTVVAQIAQHNPKAKESADCWLRWWSKIPNPTSRATPRSARRWPRTGSSAPAIPRCATAASLPPAASMATRWMY
ncbi:MAG: transposase [Actinomycetota bacterium]